MQRLSNRRSLGGAGLGGGAADENNLPSPAVQSKKSGHRNKRYSSAFDLKPSNSPTSHEEKRRQQAVAELYQDVVKRVQENKLTAKNAFGSRNIIDNLDVVLQLAKGSFHKASCAVSTAAEVYCLEVDDLCATTTLVQEMLFDSSNKRGGMDGEEARATRKKTEGTTTSSAASTLETNLANIRSDQVEAELEIDAQFQKLLQGKDTGAQGMLLNILGVCNGPNLALDCTGIPAFPAYDDDDENQQALKIELPRDFVLKTPKFLEFCTNPSFLALREELANRNSSEIPQEYNSVVESLDPRIAFVAPALPERTSLDRSMDSGSVAERVQVSTPASGTSGPSTHQYEDYEYEDYGDADGGDDYYDDDGGVGVSESGGATTVVDETPSALPFIMKAFEAQAMEAESGKIDYFEAPDLLHETTEGSMTARANGKYWLGDQHWKAPRARRVQGDNEMKPARKKREADERIDFFAEQVSEKLLFQKPATARTNQLPKSTFQKGTYVLPRSTHFTMKDLTKLFLRPKSSFKPMSVALVPGSTADEAPYNYEDYGDYDGGGGFDDDDDNGFYDCEGPSGSTPLKNLVAPAHHVERIRVAYATRAKKVDVKKLKADLWETIDNLASGEITVPKSEDELAEEDQEDKPEGVDDKPEVSLVGSIKTLAPKESNDNITVPFYFICMLHLANEHGLELQSSSNLDDVKIIKTC